jgi:hypothetical protein
MLGINLSKKLSKRIFTVHFILWIALSFWTIRFFMPMLKYGIPFGITLSAPENGSSRVNFTIVDFPFIFNFAQKAWTHQTTVSSGSSVYSVENHLKVTSDWAGQKVGRSLHFGYSPTMLWVLAPLIHFSSATAYFIFNMAGLLLTFWITRPNRCRLGVGLLSFFSPLAQLCFVLGQNSILTGAGLLYLAEKNRPESYEQGWRNSLLSGSVLWALTAKPTIALLAIAALSGMRRWHTIFTAAILTVISTIVITPWLGPHWIKDYIHILRSYNIIEAGQVFSWAISPENMANLRAIMRVDLSFTDNVAIYTSGIVWLIMLATIAVLGPKSRLSASSLWAISILSYLLFCPHVGTTEALQIIAILALCVSPRDKLSWQELVLFITLPLLVFISPVPEFLVKTHLPLFFTQFFLFIFIAAAKKSSLSTSLTE